MKLTLPQPIINDTDGFSDEVDIFKRKEFGDHLSNLILNSEEDLVIALDAKWGEGKSTFIKMWKGENQHKRAEPIKTIYFDAFENDYQKDPFLALASELYEVIEEEFPDDSESFKKKAGAVFKTFGRGLIKAGVKVGTAGIIDGTAIDAAEKDLSSLISNQVDSLIASKFENSKKDKLALKEFKDFISDVANNKINEKKLVFIIDELDRCRPDFALELLEKIKHLFSVPGITFLLVMNKEQLEESVRARYGGGIDSSTYLQKFIHIWLNLPKANDRYTSDYKRFMDNAVKHLTKDSKLYNNEALYTLVHLIEHNDVSFREVERMLTYFSLIERVKNCQMIGHYQELMAVVCYLKVCSPMLFSQLNNKDLNLQDFADSLNLQTFSDSFNATRILDLIHFDLVDYDKKREMIQQGQVHTEHGSIYEDVMKHFANILINIQDRR